jgi:hypothetical protein
MEDYKFLRRESYFFKSLFGPGIIYTVRGE